MKCPNCVTEELQDPTEVSLVDVNVCNTCGGIWFDKDELLKAKDEEAKYAKWFDFDIWEDPTKFKPSESQRKCPKDGSDLFTLAYDESDVQIDVCKQCQGIWLDKNEFEKIIEYVKGQADHHVLNDYFSSLAEETKEIFTGPKDFRSEVSDVLMLIDMFKYKFAVQHPKLLLVLQNLPLTT
jgi:Zn-finger nucleic acid-binding protein